MADRAARRPPTLGASNLRQQRRLWNLLGHPEMAKDDNDQRHNDRAREMALLTELLRARTADEWERFLEDNATSCSVPSTTLCRNRSTVHLAAFLGPETELIIDDGLLTVGGNRLVDHEVEGMDNRSAWPVHVTVDCHTGDRESVRVADNEATLQETVLTAQRLQVDFRQRQGRRWPHEVGDASNFRQMNRACYDQTKADEAHNGQRNTDLHSSTPAREAFRLLALED
jgi:hypothetical protein